jgi:signal peptidase I
MIRDAHLHEGCCHLVAEVVRATGSAKLKVTGLSMLPAIWPGDVLTVNKISPKMLERGQIVLYRGDGKLTAHRVVQVAHDHFLTRGDCVPSLDPPVTFSAMVGLITDVCRNGRAAKLQPSPWQRAAAWFLRHSDLSIRLLLHLRAALQRLTEVPQKQIL